MQITSPWRDLQDPTVARILEPTSVGARGGPTDVRDEEGGYG
jgi:hypothetical protein